MKKKVNQKQKSGEPAVEVLKGERGEPGMEGTNEWSGFSY